MNYITTELPRARQKLRIHLALLLHLVWFNNLSSRRAMRDNIYFYIYIYLLKYPVVSFNWPGSVEGNMSHSCDMLYTVFMVKLLRRKFVFIVLASSKFSYGFFDQLKTCTNPRYWFPNRK
jgi:hypothetical protein